MQNDMRDRLVELLDKEYVFAEDIADEILADGWIRPPYKIGSMVWVITSQTSDDKNLHIFVDTITHYRIVDGCTIMCFEKHLGVPNWDWDNVLPTKDQAEQKLKEMRVENG